MLKKWTPGDPISAGRLNATNSQAMQSRRAVVHGPGSAMVGDNFGPQAAHHQKPNVILCVAKEDFAAGKHTDNYAALDKIPSGKCMLMRFSVADGTYKEENEFVPFRVWDPLAVLGPGKEDSVDDYGQPISILKDDVFYAAHNKHTNRIEVLSTAPSVRLREGLSTECLGGGWYLVELAEFLKSPPDDYADVDCDTCAEFSPTEYDQQDECQAVLPYEAVRERPVGLGQFVYAHDARTLKIKDGGHVRMLPIHKDQQTGEQLYAIISAEYEMLRVPVTDWECCNGEVIQTRCDFLLIEGTLCEVWQDECY